MAKSNSSAPRLSINIDAITTGLKKGLEEARKELKTFNDQVKGASGTDFKNALNAEKLALATLKTEAQQARTEIAQLALAKNKAKSETTALSGSYREAQQRLTALGKAIREAEGGFTNTTPAIRAQISEYNALNNKLKEFDKAMGNNYRNVGNYKSGIESIGNSLAQYVTIAGLATFAQNQLQKAFDTNLKLDSLRTALGNISGDSKSLAENLNFLESISERLGLEFVSTADAFKMWQGAAKFSNFTAEESRKIFESVANAGAKMKLSTEEVKGTFFALSQMISKGKVSMEELRRQLGDRLPGAFSLAAKAMNMSEQELDKLISTGNLATKDFLPKFAEQLDKSFGNDKTQKIESMQASVNRLSNALTEMYESEGATNFFTVSVNGMTKLTKAFNDFISSKGFSGFMNAMTLIGAPSNALGSIIGSAITGKEKGKYSGKAISLEDFGIKTDGFSIFTEDINKQSSAILRNKEYWKEQVDTIKASIGALDSSKRGTKEWIDLNNKLAVAQKNLDFYDPKKNKVKGKTQADIIKEANEALGAGQIRALEGIDAEMAKIDAKWDNINAKINKITDSALKKQKLGLSAIGRETEKYNKFLDIFAKSSPLKESRGDLPRTTSGVLNTTSSLPNLAWNKWGIDNRRRSPSFTSEQLGDDFSKQFKSTLRRGLSSIFNDLFSDITTMSQENYSIEKKYANLRKEATQSQIEGLNRMEALERKINNGLTNMISKIGGTFVGIGGNMLSSALSTGISSGNFSDLTGMFKKGNKAVGYGALGSLAGGMIQGVSSPTNAGGQILGGLLAGAGTGAAIGSVVPVIGTAVGAAVGAVVGAVSGLFNANKAKKQQQLAEEQLNEQKKLVALQERQMALAYASSVIGQKTNQGIVTGVERNEFGDLVSRVRGSDLELVIERSKSSR